MIFTSSLPSFEVLDYPQRELIEKHLDLVLEANRMMNLTRIDTREEGLILHVEDSLAALSELQRAPSGLYGDLGSGAGYPGIPLAVATGRQTKLIDARQKKAKVLKEIVERLGLAHQIDVFVGRAELLARKQPGRYSVLTARALAKLSVLMELASPLLEQGGQLICYKAQPEESELEHALDMQGQTGMRIVSDRRLVVAGDLSRRVIVFEKAGEPAIKLPRKEGMAQKRPL